MRKLEYNQGSDDFDQVAKTFVEEALKADIPVESDAKKAKHMIKNDLRDAIPPQLFALMGEITSAIESVSGFVSGSASQSASENKK